MKRKVKKVSAFLLVIVTILLCSVTAEAKTEQPNQKTNWQIVKELCRKSGYKKIKLVDANKLTDKQLWKILDHLKGKPYIVVEKFVSVSDGTGYGWYGTGTKGAYYITGYNKRVPRGRKVTSYLIWNPKTNECDDILYVVDNKMYRS